MVSSRAAPGSLAHFESRAHRSKKGGEVEHPEKSKKQHESHRQECVQPVRTNQDSRNGCLHDSSHSASMAEAIRPLARFLPIHDASKAPWLRKRPRAVAADNAE
jgi:hypothetical protein